VTAGQPASARAARVVWAAVALAAATATAILVAFRAMGVAPVPEVSIPSLPLRGAALLLLVGATLALRVVRATFPEVRGDRDAWWTANLGKAVAIWALADGIAILGAVAYLLAGDTLVLALAVGWAAAMFVGHAPGRLTDG
jgi:hypothetical protein